MIRAAAVNSTWMTPTTTEARLLSWGDGPGGSGGHPGTGPTHTASHTGEAGRGRGQRPLYLELGLLKDGLRIEHDGIDARQLLEGHQGNADDEGLVDARTPQLVYGKPCSDGHRASGLLSTSPEGTSVS